MPTNRSFSTPLAFFATAAAIGGFAAGFWVRGATTPDSASAAAPSAETRAVSDATVGRTNDSQLASVSAPTYQEPAINGSSSAQRVPKLTASDLESARQSAATVDAMSSGDRVFFGHVLDVHGAPIVGATVALLKPRVSAFAMAPAATDAPRGDVPEFEDTLERAAANWAARDIGRDTTTDSEGRFEFKGLPAAGFRAVARLEGWSFRSIGSNQMASWPADAEQDGAHLEGSPLHRVTVRLNATDGTQIDEALLHLDESGRSSRWVKWSSADPDVLAVTRDFRITAYAEPYTTVESTRASNPLTRLTSERRRVYVKSDETPEVSLDLHANCILLGLLRGVREGHSNVFAKKLADGSTFDPSKELRDYRSDYARGGTFTFTNLLPGRYAIGLVGEGDMPLDATTIDVAYGLNEVEVIRSEVDRSKCIRILSYSPAGDRLEGVGYTFEWEKKGGKRDTEGMGVLRNIDGADLIEVENFVSFDFEEWPAGTTMWLAGKHPYFGRAVAPLARGASEITLNFTEPIHLNVQINGDISDGGFSIIVRDASVKTDRWSSLANASQTSSSPRVTPDGRVTFRGLSPGPVDVELTRSMGWWGNGIKIAKERVQLTDGTNEVTFTAAPLSDVVVALAPPAGERGIQIFQVDEDGEERHLKTSETDENGRAKFSRFPPGEYLLKDQENGAQMSFVAPAPLVRWDQSEHVLKLKVSVSDLDGALTEWGLKGGDLLVSLNGQPIESTKWFWDQLRESERCTVGVERGAETLSVEIPKFTAEDNRSKVLGGSLRLNR